MTDPQPPTEEFSDDELAIVQAALTILPHLGPDATVEYIDSAYRTLMEEDDST